MVASYEGVEVGLGEAPIPVFVTPIGGELRLHSWAEIHRSVVERLLSRHGAILFRGFALRDKDDFASCARVLSPNLVAYTYRSTPRTMVGNRIYTSTEYPARLEIPLHCENAFQSEWPKRLMFCCLKAATSGGRTPLADVSRVTERLPSELKERFAAKGLMYVRNYRGDVDLSWQTAFQCDERRDVEQFCTEKGIEWRWLENGGLRTSQVRPALAKHPVRGQELWFNQAHLFHISNMDSAVRSALIDLFGVQGLPRNAYFGDGSPLPEEDLDVVRRAFEAERVVFEWKEGDVLLLDNMRIAHGRESYTGDRAILCAMGELHRSHSEAR